MAIFRSGPPSPHLRNRGFQQKAEHLQIVGEAVALLPHGLLAFTANLIPAKVDRLQTGAVREAFGEYRGTLVAEVVIPHAEHLEILALWQNVNYHLGTVRRQRVVPKAHQLEVRQCREYR